MDDTLNEYRSQTQPYTHVAVQMDSQTFNSFLQFSVSKLVHDPNSMKKTDRESRVL